MGREYVPAPRGSGRLKSFRMSSGACLLKSPRDPSENPLASEGPPLLELGRPKCLRGGSVGARGHVATSEFALVSSVSCTSCAANTHASNMRCKRPCCPQASGRGVARPGPDNNKSKQQLPTTASNQLSTTTTTLQPPPPATTTTPVAPR